MTGAAHALLAAVQAVIDGIHRLNRLLDLAYLGGEITAAEAEALSAEYLWAAHGVLVRLATIGYPPAWGW